MTSDRTAFEKTLHRHLSLFGSPSGNQLEASRARIRERLRSRHEAAVSDRPSHVAAPGVHVAWRASLALAAAAAVVVLVITAPWTRTDWLATVEAADGSHYTLAPHATLRSTDARGTMLTLKDGSRVEMRSQSELSLERAADGIGIRLRTGGLIVDAAQQRDAHLYVHTRDMTVTVAGTMFVVNAGDAGSRVTVLEGEVRVREKTIETRLKPGEQVSTSPTLAKRAMQEEIGWSRRAGAILAAFARGMSDTAGPLTTRANPPGALRAVPPRAAASQTPRAERPEFEEASIRQCDPDNLPVTPDGGRGGGANSFQLIPGRVRALCVTTATLIRTAYGYGPVDLDFFARGGGARGMTFGGVYGLGVEDGRRVRGGPDWVRSERYTIEAIAGDGVQVDAETLRGPMLQRLLERRLHLKAHIESEDIPAFALTVARSGMKIRAVPVTACDPLPGGAGSPPRSFSDVRAGQRPSCGLRMQRHGPNAVFVGGGVPLSALANVLGARLGGVRVIDRTGAGDDRFNFLLEFVVDENSPGLPGGDLPAPPDAGDIPRAATIFTALEEELGLRLERDRASREFIVIDHVERPTPN